MFGKESRFNKIVKDIESIKIQGALNIAKAALKAYSLLPSKSSKRKLLNTRPTEPMMENVLEMAEKGISKNQILKHFSEAQEKINQEVLKLIKKKYVLFTHCHSTNVVRALINAHKKGKYFQVYNTETRPLFQGRKTAKELKKAGINVTMFVDSAMGIALGKEFGTKKVNLVFLGADALTPKGAINKVGSEVIARLAKMEGIPVFIIADSWKFTKSKIPLEKRKLNEIWDKVPKKIKIKNPAFEFIDKKYISGVITEKGILNYNSFVRHME